MTRTLRSFGAQGDGITDDSRALSHAFDESDRQCLDGERRSYRVTGTLRVTKNLCLRNARLVQASHPVDTTPFIRRSCPNLQDPVAVVDCGDPPIPAGQLERLNESLFVRTLLIRPGDEHDRLKVNLDHVVIDRGSYAAGGSRTDSAGIWLEGAERVDFRDVEITGNGKGFGLLLIRSNNVTLTNLYIHDLVWAPYHGDLPLTEARVAAAGWNAGAIHEFRAKGPGIPAAKFYGVRIQEQLACAFLSEVRHVRIEHARIERCMASFVDGDLPWQTDGLDIGQSSSDIRVNGAVIDSIWEAIDVVANGSGIDGLVVSNLSVSNAFSFGLKLGYRLRGAIASGLRMSNVGLAGVTVYGPVNGVTIDDVTIREVGVIQGPGGPITPWPAPSRAGIRIDFGSRGTEAERSAPRNIVVEDTLISNRQHPAAYEFGIRNETGAAVRAVRFRAQGFNRAPINGPATLR